MYKGSNRTALRSRESIISTLATLMEERSYASISIKEICAQAGLSRQTFYNLFESKDDVMRAYLDQIVESEFSWLTLQKRITLDDIIRTFASVLAHYGDFLKKLIAQNLEPLVNEAITGAVQIFTRDIVSQSNEGFDREYGIAFISGGIAQSLLLWIKTGNRLTRSRLDAFLRKALSGGLIEFDD